jgi:hypothetical protein
MRHRWSEHGSSVIASLGVVLILIGSLLAVPNSLVAAPPPTTSTSTAYCLVFCGCSIFPPCGPPRNQCRGGIFSDPKKCALCDCPLVVFFCGICA